MSNAMIVKTKNNTQPLKRHDYKSSVGQTQRAGRRIFDTLDLLSYTQTLHVCRICIHWGGFWGVNV